MNTITISEEIDWMDFCPTETSTQITNIVPRTQPIISAAFIESARDRGTDLSEDVLRQRVIDLLKHNRGISYTKLQIYNKVVKASSGNTFKCVQSIIEDMKEGGSIDVYDSGYAIEYTFSEIKSSAIQEIKDRGQIAEEYKRWIPRRWR